MCSIRRRSTTRITTATLPARCCCSKSMLARSLANFNRSGFPPVGKHRPGVLRCGSDFCTAATVGRSARLDDGFGAQRAVAAVTLEWLLSVRSRDLRRGSGQWARRADSRLSLRRPETGKFDPLLPFTAPLTSVAPDPKPTPLRLRPRTSSSVGLV